MLYRLLFVCLAVSTATAETAKTKPPAKVVAEAVYTSLPIKFDGKLDDPAWKTAPGYTFHAQIAENKIRQNGIIKFLWNDKYLYIGAELDDDDLVQNNLKDQQHHYRTGDVLEVFLRQPGDTLYWELYSTPAGNRTSFLILGGRSMIGGDKDIVMKGLKVASVMDGTLNNWHDKDKKWTTEMIVPISELALKGGKIKPGEVWRFFVTRINFTRYYRFREVSCVADYNPKIITAHHGQDHWGRLVFVQKASTPVKHK